MRGTDPVAEYALAHFGIAYLYPYQRLVIANVLDSLDAVDGETERQVVILPTGAGKSLCFQLPAALCPGPTLVMYPLLGLMADQRRRLEAAGIATVVIKGGMTATDKDEAFSLIRLGTTRLILANPEIVAVPDILNRLANVGIHHFVVDEAHCIAEWGDSFRPAYRYLGDVIRAINPRVVTAFTATASPPILARLAHVLFGDAPYRLIAGMPDRPGIRYEVRPTLCMSREIICVLASLPRPALVFVRSRAGTELLAESLRARLPCIDTRFYHAGLDRIERAELEAWFMASTDGVLCATCAYGMGMDKSDIRTVIHYGPPASIEAYMQESGRAGRDGRPAFAVLLHEIRDDREMDGISPGKIMDGSAVVAEQPATDEKQLSGDEMAKRRADMMQSYATSALGCRRTFLLSALGHPDATSVACHSCDRCDGTSVEIADGVAEIQALARRHPRRFTSRQASAFAVGDPSSIGAALRGSMHEWRAEEAHEAMEKAVAAGFIGRLRRGPWQQRLIPKIEHQSGSSSS
jgi:ATP-dependent DNA helicase RecQ